VLSIDPLYFLDEMSWSEMGAIIKARNEQELATIKRTWEQTRAICFYDFTAIKGNRIKLESGGILELNEPKDLFRLSWEKADKKEEQRNAPRNKEEAMERHRQIKLNKYKMK